MSRERNRTHARNRKKKEMQFFNNKATFVAGVAVIMMSINDIIGLVMPIPMWITWVEIGIMGILYVLALITKKLDNWLGTKGAENFGAFLTVFSIAEFMLGRAWISSVEGMKFEWKLSNEVLQAVFCLSILTAVAIGGAFFLLFAKHPKEK